MNIATVFSGIGAPEFALKKNFSIFNPKIVFACDCGECSPLDNNEVELISKIQDPIERQENVKFLYINKRKKHWVKEVYFHNYSSMGITEEKWHDDIRFIDGSLYNGAVDLFIGGSPCQSFSNMGKRGGLNDVRGTLFYDYARLIKEIKPSVFVYENVPGMLSHDNGNTWGIIKSVFSSLGYYFDYMILNSKDFGIPQNRRRLFVVGFLKKRFFNKFTFPSKKPLQIYANYFLDNEVPLKYFLGKKGFKFVTTNHSRARINMDIIRTEKRNQQFNWNGDFVFVPASDLKINEEFLEKVYLDKYEGLLGAVRKMTPRECHRLMGFTDDFVICENDIEAYKQAGNSIVVNVISDIINSIVKTGVFKNEKN